LGDRACSENGGTDATETLDFRTLVATRGARLDASHVAALNMVALDFAENTETSRAVVAACKAYFHELNQAQGGDAQRAIDLLDQLLYQISRALGFNFDHADMKSRWYSPNWFLYTAQYQAQLHDLVRALHERGGVIPVSVVSGPVVSPPIANEGLAEGAATPVRLGAVDARAAE
jgi:hypothetical protein